MADVIDQYVSFIQKFDSMRLKGGKFHLIPCHRKCVKHMSIVDPRVYQKYGKKEMRETNNFV